MLLRANNLRIPGVVHGFTTRHGGVSEGSFASLNVSAKRGDSPARVEENLRRICDAGGFARDRLVRVVQVHGAEVVHASALEPGSEADALWTRRGEDAVVSVTTADCVPIVLVEPEVGLAAAIHSGWRGTVADIVGVTVARLSDAGARPGRIRAAIGPCIEVGAFEVGEEVAERFEARFVARAGTPKPHVDLVACVTDQLRRAGVPSIERVGGCTHSDPGRYFSYRRDGITTGQALSFVGFE